MNLPNALTALRIFLVPLLVVVLLTRAEHHVFLGAAIFGLAALTDYLDGYFARRHNQVTRVGILLDPLADKLLTAAAFLSLVELGAVPAWMVMIILGREFAVTGLRNVAAGRGVLVPASVLGKAKMIAQVVCILLLLLGRRYPLLQAPGLLALWAVVVLALVSAADYFRLFWRGVVRGPALAPTAGKRPAAPQVLPGGAARGPAAIAAPRDRRP
ncbi:MAG TPA: CDP-diacylglycerol--glycerol-3-phosphate 3-phosphatidyltransferase [Vicinamibacteria bacterium]|nr:CDP-diacylglycerol--glycerol-3-phosphate 3-phosphatidyltransferase [Vicinamibacteria bacterium]